MPYASPVYDRSMRKTTSDHFCHMFLWMGKGNLGFDHMSDRVVIGRESNSHWLAETESFYVAGDVFLSIDEGSCWKRVIRCKPVAG